MTPTSHITNLVAIDRSFLKNVEKSGGGGCKKCSCLIKSLYSDSARYSTDSIQKTSYEIPEKIEVDGLKKNNDSGEDAPPIKNEVIRESNDADEMGESDADTPPIMNKMIQESNNATTEGGEMTTITTESSELSTEKKATEEIAKEMDGSGERKFGGNTATKSAASYHPPVVAHAVFPPPHFPRDHRRDQWKHLHLPCKGTQTAFNLHLMRMPCLHRPHWLL